MGLKTIFPIEKVRKFESLLDESERIVLTCHMRPDGDAIGSSLGLYHLLKGMGKDAMVVLPDRIPESLSFLPGTQEMAVFTLHEEYSRRLLAEADLLIMLDFNTMTRQGRLGPVAAASPARKVLIDHHRFPDLGCELEFSYPEMSSTCELAFRLIAAAGLYENLDLPAATCLLTGLITDTQNFTVNVNSPEVYEIMMHLLEKGADKEQIIYEAVKSTSYNALRLNSFAISERLEILPAHRSALICLDKKDLKEFGYNKGDTEGLVNEPLRIRGIVSSIFLREDDDCIKVSMRSRLGYPVGKICREVFDGGGHDMAAGAEFEGSLEDCRQLIIDHLGDYDQYLPKKLDKLELK